MLLGVDSQEEMLTNYKPISDEEMKDYLADGDDGTLACTVQQYRVDLDRPVTSVFNRQAQAVFVKSFLAAVAASQYTEVSFPAVVLKPAIIGAVWNRHIAYRCRTYRQRRNPKVNDDEYKKKKAANARKHTVSLFA